MTIKKKAVAHVVQRRKPKDKTLVATSKLKRTRTRRRRTTPFAPYFNHAKYVYEGSWLQNLKHPSPLNSQDCGYVLYLLTSSDRQGKLYVGTTNDIHRRWHQSSGFHDKGCQAARKWIAKGNTLEPVVIVRGFQTRHDVLCLEQLVQKMRLTQFCTQVPFQWKGCKDQKNRALKNEMRKLLVALKTNRWKDYVFQLCWFQREFRPKILDLQSNHSESDYLGTGSSNFSFARRNNSS